MATKPAAESDSNRPFEHDLGSIWITRTKRKEEVTFRTQDVGMRNGFTGVDDVGFCCVEHLEPDRGRIGGEV